jgi:hypothetical protein
VCANLIQWASILHPAITADEFMISDALEASLSVHSVDLSSANIHRRVCGSAVNRDKVRAGPVFSACVVSHFNSS